MSAVFQQLREGSVTSGPKVTDDMKTKNRVDRSGAVSAIEKETHTSKLAFSKTGPPKLELQMGRKRGSAPTVSVDNTTGCQLYLSKDSLDTSTTTAKSSEINVMVPGSSPDGNWVEHALPQQYNQLFTEGKFETTPV
ncbi:hypothetical protein Bca4012_015634 [Brassica carinata]